MSDLAEFSIIPVLGRKTDVPQNDPSLFMDYGGHIATHDVGGKNFDLSRRRHACSKANGYSLWSNTANDTATQCLGLFELYSGGNRDHLYADGGAIYLYDGERNPLALTNVKVGFDSGGTTEPTIGETVSENGGDASGVLAAYHVSSGTWSGGDAAGTFYIQSSSGTWTDNAQLDGSASGSDMATVNGTADSDTFASDASDLYCMLRAGDYFVFADHGETTPHKWKHGDQSLTPLITSGTPYKFRYLVSFARRLIGLYCPDDSNAPELSVRWSSSWPATSIDNMTFSETDQLYIPNDDPIVGGKTMGRDKCFIYCENSIQQLVYYPDYETPFGCFTVVPEIGAVNHNSIVSLGHMHFFYNKDYGFMRYDGGSIPVPISDDIETDISTINSELANLIVGCYVPNIRCVVWAAPLLGEAAPNTLLFYQIDTQQWFFVERSMRYVDYWRTYSSYSWIDLIRDLGGMGKSSGTADTDTTNKLVDSTATFVTDGVVVGDEAFNTTDGLYANITAVDSETSLSLDSDAFPDGNEDYQVGTGATWANAGATTWAQYASLNATLVYAGTDGHLYRHAGETNADGTSIDGYVITPVLDFGDAKRKDLLEEVWFQFLYEATHSLDVYHRSGDTVGECMNGAWTSVGSIALNASMPVVYVSRSARLHQIKFGTDSGAEYFEINKIVFKYSQQSEM